MSCLISSLITLKIKNIKYIDLFMLLLSVNILQIKDFNKMLIYILSILI